MTQDIDGAGTSWERPYEEEAAKTATTTTTTTESGPPASRKASSDVGQYTMGLIMLLGYYVLIGTFMLADIQENRLGPVKEILNYMTPLVGVMIGYFFGGALSGRRKDDMIASAVIK